MNTLGAHLPAGLHEALARSAIHARALLGHRRYQKFVVVGVARTGSTLLLDLLNSDEQVLAFGELFRGGAAIGWDRWPFQTRQSPRLLRLHDTEPLEFLRTAVYCRWPREIGAVGFKLFYYHARTGPQAAVWDYLRNATDVAVIHLKRRNILAQYLSLRAAHATNVWSTSKPDAPLEPLRLDPEDCLRHFIEVRGQEEACDAFFGGERMLTIVYEDLVADRGGVMNRVAAHLGLRLRSMDAKLVRQRTQPLPSAIANYEQLRDCFAGSRWESFFQSPEPALSEEAA